MNAKQSKMQIVDAGEIGDLLGVRAETIRRWAKKDKIPKIVLPNGRSVFEPPAVISALRQGQQHRHLAPTPERVA